MLSDKVLIAPVSSGIVGGVEVPFNKMGSKALVSCVVVVFERL